MANHAYLSASASHRWLACPPSVKLCENIPDTPSPYAQEGTDCHELCAYLVEKAIGKDVIDPTENLSYYNQEMQSCAEDYRNYVLEQYEAAKKQCSDPHIFIEQRLDFSKWVERGFGTGDCVIVADDVLHIIDYKHGLGVLVEAENNSQMMCYALGALELFGDLYDIKQIVMTIFQPRRDNISTWCISKEELLTWAKNVLKPTAALAYEGKGEFCAGAHCVFCRAKDTCRKRAEYNLELTKHEFAQPALLSSDEIAEILPKLEQLLSWGNDVKEYALEQAQRGTKFKGFKVVEGRSNRKYTDENAVANAVKQAGFDPYEQKLLSITAMSAMLGKNQFDEILGGLVFKPPGKPTLVPESDKRSELNTAKNDFNCNCNSLEKNNG